MIVALEDEFPEAIYPDFRAGLVKELQRGWELEKAQYHARQLAARKEVEATPLKTIEGLGQLESVIDARTYFRWIEEDPNFWDDRKNHEKFLKDNPECKAPAPKPKISIIV